MQGRLVGRVSREIEVRSCADYLHKLFAFTPDQLAKLSPLEIQGCSVLEGEFGKNGSVIVWHYSLDGKSHVIKEIMESVDMEERKITYRVMEGSLKEGHKSFLIYLHVMPKADNMSLVKWTCEYEKLNEGVNDPNAFANYLAVLTKNVDAYLNA